ncbi:hypothetical protein ABIE13_001887 [Ottowia thiooxydans]|uniref:Uncharacterized protein n=1 Tax=Ottowia thiooxydans TaxID=219182 RepID=A0ABV2Q865_9BURK
MSPADVKLSTEARADQRASTPASLPGRRTNLNPEVSL